MYNISGITFVSFSGLLQVKDVEVSFIRTPQNSLTYGDAVRAAGHSVDDADQTQTAGRHGAAGAEDAAVVFGGGLRFVRGWLSDVAAGRRGLSGRDVFNGEGV